MQVEILRLDLLEPAVVTGGRVVADEPVEATEPLGRRFDDPPGLGGVGEVGTHLDEGRVGDQV